MLPAYSFRPVADNLFCFAFLSTVLTLLSYGGGDGPRAFLSLSSHHFEHFFFPILVPSLVFS